MTKMAKTPSTNAIEKGTIAASVARYKIDVIRKVGLDEKRLCYSVGLNMAELDDPNGRISKAVLFRLFSLASAESKMISLGLQCDEYLDAGFLGIVGYTMMSCSNFKQALQRLERYSVLLDDELEVWTEREEGNLRLSARIGSVERYPFDYMMAGIKGFLSFCKVLLGSYPITHELNVMYGRPNSYEEGTLFFKNINFEMPFFSILFDADTLSKPLRSFNPNLDRVHVDIAEAMLENFNSVKSVDYIRQLISESLSGRALSLGDLAIRLSVSKRTLQRELEVQETSFKEILDDVRKQQAKQYLLYSKKNMKEISWSLGFVEISSFYRASHQWFGMTPKQYRFKHQEL
ncbi:hypothetical protein LCGC14_0057530 [marine sediment metagenome]|uniref:HTH araC/xylS-type domain-containing protein n=1 Tax=marine sediment metagenome TaxID=412755 RepID=A0A0F9VSY5_9ZZZZ|nr:AraC family transcriptional regulator [Halomonas sp.]HDZ47454.1 AraC family transcriptional regulator [Halomonas sp.]HEB05323.1 AraC family transcriptional regulator [Halomonas sp.]